MIGKMISHYQIIKELNHGGDLSASPFRGITYDR